MEETWLRQKIQIVFEIGKTKAINYLAKVKIKARNCMYLFQ